MKTRVLIGAAVAMFCVQDLTASSDFEALIESCGEAVQGLTNDLKAQYRANEFPDDPVTHCFVRCLGLTLKLYDDEQGPDLHANWEHLGSVDEEAEFVTQHRLCLDELDLEAVEGQCEKAYSVFQCFKNEYFNDTENTEPDADRR
uniref:Uncharacterized protein n=1 Tax=Anopheles atroparvus TaxID=41427 RepID=A0AAG5D0G1_ANOAO